MKKKYFKSVFGILYSKYHPKSESVVNDSRFSFLTDRSKKEKKQIIIKKKRTVRDCIPERITKLLIYTMTYYNIHNNIGNINLYLTMYTTPTVSRLIYRIAQIPFYKRFYGEKSKVERHSYYFFAVHRKRVRHFFLGDYQFYESLKLKSQKRSLSFAYIPNFTGLRTDESRLQRDIQYNVL